MPTRFGPGIVLAILASAASAQSINIDFGPFASPVGSPPPAHGGPANSPGVWNRVSTTLPVGLRAWDGAPTGVTLWTDINFGGCNGIFHQTDVSGTSGEEESLLDDRYSGGYPSVVWYFGNLEPGDYEAFAILADDSGCLNGFESIRVSGSPDDVQILGGTWPGSYTLGSNFTRHTKTVTDGSLILQIEANFPGYPMISGIQLVKLGSGSFTGSFLCYGDGTGSSCPCTNDGEPGFGCGNSEVVGGAFLHARGSTSPDRVVLTASGETSTALTIFLQGSTTIGPRVFGDGLLCTGGILKRLYAKAATGGDVSAPGAGDPSITARSAALGDPIAPGGHRVYQVLYRDTDPIYPCAPPTGGSLNTSNAVEIVW